MGVQKDLILYEIVLCNACIWPVQSGVYACISEMSTWCHQNAIVIRQLGRSIRITMRLVCKIGECLRENEIGCRAKPSSSIKSVINLNLWITYTAKNHCYVYIPIMTVWSYNPWSAWITDTTLHRSFSNSFSKKKRKKDIISPSFALRVSATNEGIQNLCLDK